MPLESLFELVETLKGRVETHGNALQSSEALTRYALIDPLLRESGWDTSDPAVVVPEYRSGSGSADYALLNDGGPAMMVEAKKLGTPLQDPVILQVLNYCQMEGTKHFAITDGARWSIYDTHKPVPMNEKRVAEFNLINQPPTEFCLKALSLWRPSVQAGYVAGGQTPIISEPSVSQTMNTTTTPTASTSQTEDWHPLTNVDHKGSKPVEMLFPDGGRADLKNWYDLPTESVRWLSNQDLLNTTRCPIRAGPRAKRYIVNTQPFHLEGIRFSNQNRLVNGFHVELKYDARGHIRNTKTIINHVGQDPAQFKVRFD